MRRLYHRSKLCTGKTPLKRPVASSHIAPAGSPHANRDVITVAVEVDQMNQDGGSGNNTARDMDVHLIQIRPRSMRHIQHKHTSRRPRIQLAPVSRIERQRVNPQHREAGVQRFPAGCCIPAAKHAILIRGCV